MYVNLEYLLLFAFMCRPGFWPGIIFSSLTGIRRRTITDDPYAEFVSGEGENGFKTIVRGNSYERYNE